MIREGEKRQTQYHSTTFYDSSPEGKHLNTFKYQATLCLPQSWRRRQNKHKSASIRQIRLKEIAHNIKKTCPLLGQSFEEGRK